MIPCRTLTVAMLAAVVTLAPVSSSSHSLLVRSEPGQRSTVARPPERVRMWFSERLEPAYAAASVWSAAGKRVDAGDTSVDPGDPTMLSVSTPNLAPGRYTVRFRVVSVDGHVVESSYTFTIRAGAR
jgi:copper resistance protein C